MFPKTDSLHLFKPKAVYKATGGGILEKLGKSGIKTVSKIIKKKIVSKKSKKPRKKQSSSKKKKKNASGGSKKKKKTPHKKSKKGPIRDIFS